MDQLIKEAKAYLLQRDIVNRIKEDNSDGTIDTLSTIFETLSKPIIDNSIVLDDPGRLILIDTFSIWMVRSTKIIQNKKINSVSFSRTIENKLLSSQNCNIILQYIIDFWSDSTPALSNALRDLLNKFLTLLKIVLPNEQFNEFLSYWLDLILTIPSMLRIHYNLIEIFAVDLDMYNLLEKRPHFIESSLHEIAKESLANAIGKCLVNVLVNIYKLHFKNDIKNIIPWISLWNEHTLSGLQQQKYTKPISLYFLTPLFKNMPSEAFVQFLQNKDLQNEPALLLSLLKIGQNICIEEPFHDNKLISLEQLEIFLQTDEYKLATFEILTYASKKSKIVQPYIFEIIKRNLRIYFADVELENRNYFISSFKHFIIRIRDSAYAMNRQLFKLRKAEKFPKEQSDLENRLDQYLLFLQWVVRFLKCEMVPGSQYHRNLMSLNILNILICSGLDKEIPEKYLYKQEPREYPFEVSLSKDQTIFRLLVDNLSDNVPDIRKISKEILLIFNKTENSSTLFGKIDIAHFNDIVYKNMEIYQNVDIGATLESFLFNVTQDQSKYLLSLLEKLDLEVAKVQSDYISNANNKISSYLSSLSLILNELDSKSEILDIEIIIQHVWDDILEIWELVRDILCYDASDSLLPEQFLNSGLSDQLLSSYAYRSVKEMSAVLIVLLDKYALSEHMLMSIGDLLINQLFSIRHSGAFQAVLPTFRECCVRCEKNLPAQLDMWLTLILEELQTKTQHITRRSGGLPFLLTNILRAETHKQRPKLKSVFNKLFELANLEIPEHQDKLDIPQINAINCIKAIFIESGLSDSCQPYIPAALQLSFKYFNSDIWALRNCSLMLFTSIQNRIFGKSGKVLSARLFFTKYVGIKESMYKILAMANSFDTTSVEDERKYESIFLVLNILLSIKSSSGSNELDEILDEVEKFLGDKNWKVRDVAARVIASLHQDPYGKALSIINRLKLSNQNLLHGSLFTVYYVVHNRSTYDDTCDNQSYTNLVDNLIKKASLFTKENTCFETSMAYLKIVKLILNRIPNTTSSVLSHFFDDLKIYFLYHLSITESYGSKQLCLSIALEILLSYGPIEIFFMLCDNSIHSKLYEIQRTAIWFITEYDLLGTVGDIEKDKIVKRLLELLQTESTLPSVKTGAVKALRGIKNGIDKTLALSLITSQNSETTKLAVLEILGTTISSDNFDTYWNIISRYAKDSSSENTRLSVLHSIQNFSKNTQKIEVLVLLHKTLSDDDIDIRDEASHFMNQELLSNEEFQLEVSAVVTSTRLYDLLSKYCTEAEIKMYLSKAVMNYFSSNNVFSQLNEQTNILFNAEEDNQYRNNIELITQYIAILRRYTVSKELSTFCEHFITQLDSTINTKGIVDGPQGWLSTHFPLSVIILLKELVELCHPNKSKEFALMLKACHAHPIVSEYLYIDN
ncbi:similar to Saccharomyces cerevisiae YMR259C TRM732 Putative protein of unknown function [Maudiozyma saulgeensis]|uniref:Uncharacterized protein n=1 Tax=Maudiozyma saulgeensis TaxID=1789683 RepID=A0A1X7R9B1_9SACH|nr:similar to Saccharomyces cerevisiae YMR259C TRM732 Putative protein of unknown function [Kazachstania saulgeensis]